MKLKNIIRSVFILYLLFLFSAVRYYNEPAYAGNPDSDENEYQISVVESSNYRPEGSWKRYGNNSEHNEFLEYARTLNEVIHGESKGNSVQRMREDKLDMPAHWFYSDGWRELTLDQKRTLVAGCLYFLNKYLREAICFNEKMKTTYDNFSGRITVEEIVDHVNSLYKMPQHQDEDAENLILDYMQYGFWHYLGLTIIYPG